MKKILLSFCFALCYMAAFAQVSSDYEYSVGLRVYSSMQTPKILNQVNSQDYSTKYANSIFIKFNDNQLSYRIIGGYYSKQLTFSNQCEGCQTASGKDSDYFLKIGFEKSFNYSRIQPYLGFDIGYRSNAFTGVVMNNQPGSTAPNYNVEINKNGLLLSPLLGIKVNVVNGLTFFAEGTLDFYYAYERRETVDQVAGSPTVNNRFTRLEYLLNPVALGVQFNFGSRN
ncbi:MAG: hypothetical protein EOO89_22880 [Pedobacter sp.]|nr:MAG: hypothetical protein EOO89_22880 [Pedobacter sp.]